MFFSFMAAGLSIGLDYVGNKWSRISFFFWVFSLYFLYLDSVIVFDFSSLGYGFSACNNNPIF